MNFSELKFLDTLDMYLGISIKHAMENEKKVATFI